jgi:hypothetical protein
VNRDSHRPISASDRFVGAIDHALVRPSVVRFRPPIEHRRTTEDIPVEYWSLHGGEVGMEDPT